MVNLTQGLPEAHRVTYKSICLSKALPFLASCHTHPLAQLSSRLWMWGLHAS